MPLTFTQEDFMRYLVCSLKTAVDPLGTTISGFHQHLLVSLVCTALGDPDYYTVGVTTSSGPRFGSFVDCRWRLEDVRYIVMYVLQGAALYLHYLQFELYL